MTVWQYREATGYGKDKAEPVSIPDKAESKKANKKKPDDSAKQDATEDKPAE